VVPVPFIRAYLRASTEDQDASRAKSDLDEFASERDLTIAAYYVENESGAKLDRPELFRLLSDCRPGDMLLVEQVDRLSRLTSGDWQKLRGEIAARQVRVVALDLPTSWTMARGDTDAFTERMFAAVNDMLLDVLAAVARKDYEDRRRRQAQGIANARGSTDAKGQPKYRGRVEDAKRNAAIVRMLEAKQSWSSIISATGCSRSTLSRLNKRVAASLSSNAYSRPNSTPLVSASSRT
jgi:DNA invertase Pin-like site-specific DNA recombinase